MLDEVSGVGDFKAGESESVEMEICDVFVKVISLDDLIKAKRAAGRNKGFAGFTGTRSLARSFER